jgi:hypothetical protein
MNEPSAAQQMARGNRRGAPNYLPGKTSAAARTVLSVTASAGEELVIARDIDVLSRHERTRSHRDFRSM